MDTVYTITIFQFTPIFGAELIIAPWHTLFTFAENNCHRQMCVVCAVLKPWNRQYICIHKHHHQLSGGLKGDPFVLFKCVIQMQW